MTLSTLRRRYWRDGFAYGAMFGFVAGVVTLAVIIDVMGE